MSFPLQIVIIRDANGDYWGTKFLDPNETTYGTRLDSRSASSWLGKLHSDYRPMATTDDNQSSSRREIKIIDPLGAIAKRLGMQTRFEDGLFEDWLRSHLQLRGEIPREHFVATASVSDDVIAVEVSEVLDSVRYVFGTLP
ncbi:MAG: hypothetical protein HKN47_18010 [Pirellulaceae bacterium]|nr:hypothetical protein [Pirellulaceae bacterium]